MTSQVNPNNIDGTYPIAGQDNDSQGFRDNFTNIRNNFTYVKAEIEDIQNKAIFKTALSNTTLDNDFYGNIILNPSFTAWRETYNNIGSVSGTITLNFSNGNFQKITMAGTTYLTFSFPTNSSNQYASIKLWVSNSDPARLLYLPTSVTLGDPDSISGLTGTNPPVITFSSAEIAQNTDFLFEFFTVDGGTTIGVRDLLRNRDVNLSGLTVSGGLSSDSVTASGNVTSNSNLITNAGRINTNFAYVTLTDNQNFFANTAYQTLYFDTAGSATIANARIALPAAENGREINLSFLAPIGNVWVNQANTSSVKWFPNTSVSSGNVSVKLVYSSAASTWLKSA